MQPQGVRIEWDQVPAGVRADVAAELGSEVVRADNQPGGFSPGVAARCQLADGRRCFIKAVSPDQNPVAPWMHRREAETTKVLPAGLPVPTLVAVIDDGHWVVVVFDEIDGRHPDQPWSLTGLRATFDALDEVTARTTPCAFPGLLRFADMQAQHHDGFRQLAGGDDAIERVDPWTRRHIVALAELEAGWPAASEGYSLLHADLRANNLLVRPDGSIVIVDWPSACIGAGWVDKVCMLPSVGLDGGPSPVLVEQRLHPFAHVEAEAVDRVLTALAGYFTFQGVLPDPPGLPTLRSFQRAQGAVARTWLARRLRLD